MAESAEGIYRRALAAADADGRLVLPPVGEWGTFPFEGELLVRRLLPPEEAEPARRGEGGEDCPRCGSEEDLIWSDERWLLGSLRQPSGLPVVVILYPRAHHDLADLPPELAADLGPMILRIEAAVRAVGEIGRVHVCRFGEGSEHLHWWFIARPARMPQLRSSFAEIWDEILPPTPERIWRENLAVVARALAETGGKALV